MSDSFHKVGFRWNRLLAACSGKAIQRNRFPNLLKEDTNEDKYLIYCGEDVQWPAWVKQRNENNLELEWWDCGAHHEDLKKKCGFTVSREDPGLRPIYPKPSNLARPWPWRPGCKMSDDFWNEDRRCFFTSKKHSYYVPGFEINRGMYVECLHPRDRTRVYVAAVEEVYDNNTALLGIDELTKYIWSYDDLGVMPIGSCLEMRVHLEPPGDNKLEDFHLPTNVNDRIEPPEWVFSWKNYAIRKEDVTSCVLTPSQYLKDLMQGFFVGGKLEVRLPNSDRLHCATICQVGHGLLFVHVDSLPPSTPNYIFPLDSKDIFPIRSSADLKVTLNPPYGFTKTYDHVANPKDLQSVFVSANCYLGLCSKKVMEMSKHTPESRCHLFWQSLIQELVEICGGHKKQLKHKIQIENGAQDQRLLKNTSGFSDPPNADSAVVLVKTKTPQPFHTLVPLRRPFVDTFLLRLCINVFETCPIFLSTEKVESVCKKHFVCPKKCFLAARRGPLCKLLDADAGFIKRLMRAGRASSTSSRSRSSSKGSSVDEPTPANVPPVHCMTTRGKRTADSYAVLSGKRPRNRRDSSAPVAAQAAALAEAEAVIAAGEPSEPIAPRAVPKESPPRVDDGEPSGSSASVEEFNAAPRRLEVPPDVPDDIRHWSVDNVASVAQLNGYLKVVPILRQEHFDGRALLLFNTKMTPPPKEEKKDRRRRKPKKADEDPVSKVMKFVVEVTSQFLNHADLSASPRFL